MPLPPLLAYEPFPILDAPSVSMRDLIPVTAWIREQAERLSGAPVHIPQQDQPAWFSLLVFRELHARVPETSVEITEGCALVTHTTFMEDACERPQQTHFLEEIVQSGPTPREATPRTEMILDLGRIAPLDPTDLRRSIAPLLHERIETDHLVFTGDADTATAIVAYALRRGWARKARYAVGDFHITL